MPRLAFVLIFRLATATWSLSVDLAPQYTFCICQFEGVKRVDMERNLLVGVFTRLGQSEHVLMKWVISVAADKCWSCAEQRVFVRVVEALS